MEYAETTACAEDTFQMVTPLFQPLRLWTPRTGSGNVLNTRRTPAVNQHVVKNVAPSFTIKGGFMNVSGGERRMVIAGKIFR